MKIRQFVFLFVSVYILSSCASLNQKGSSSFDDSHSPYVKEETTAVTPKPKVSASNKEVVVRQEKVKVVDSENTDKTNYLYYAIIGSFRILDNAKNYKSQLIEEGFKPVLLENENGLYRISIFSSNDEMAARSRIGEVRDNYPSHADIWLLVSK